MNLEHRWVFCLGRQIWNSSAIQWLLKQTSLLSSNWLARMSERKRNYGLPTYPLFPCHNFQHKYLANRSNTIKKRDERFPQTFMFLRMLFICILSKLQFKWKASYGCQCVVSRNVVNTLLHQNSMLRGHGKCHENRATENQGYTYHTHLLCSGSCLIVSSEFTYKTQIQVLKLLKFQDSESRALS